ncbi:hypothetical protein NC99_39120 [Sunxiuqinia dokdonensis]|uniref:Uncharacterized protein n=1 Tax=Sunxiuqinia dokdonensis TaxID=1409788 RepID=A0A0L8V514_9BACT|nr:hypothetical protein NC99_39120 [Sunxiuqinia dokdonensis]
MFSSNAFAMGFLSLTFSEKHGVLVLHSKKKRTPEFSIRSSLLFLLNYGLTACIIKPHIQAP